MPHILPYYKCSLIALMYKYIFNEKSTVASPSQLHDVTKYTNGPVSINNKSLYQSCGFGISLKRALAISMINLVK